MLSDIRCSTHWSVRSGESPATRIHGIDNAMVAHVPSWSSVYAQLVGLLRTASAIVVYNAAFDRRIIHQINHRHDLSPLRANWQCAMLQFAAFVGEPNPAGAGYRWHRLEHAARAVGADRMTEHRAVADTQACRAVVEAMAATGCSLDSRRDSITDARSLAPAPGRGRRQQSPAPQHPGHRG
jgi:DNA polymerase III epsilon subunit-like protein